jgi:hypothetical protein
MEIVSVYCWRTKVSELNSGKHGTISYVVSEGHIIQPSPTTAGQVESERSISVLYILNHHHFNRVCASIVIKVLWIFKIASTHIKFCFLLVSLRISMSGVGAQDNPCTATILWFIVIPLWFIIIYDLSTRTLWQSLPADISSSEEGGTWRVMATEFCLWSISFIDIGFFDML